MKASNPNISAPISRKKKKSDGCGSCSGGGGGGLIGTLVLAILIVAVGGFFYVAVSQGLFPSSSSSSSGFITVKEEGKILRKRVNEYDGPMLDGIPHPNLPGSERHQRHVAAIDPEVVNDAYHGTLTLHTDLGDIHIDLRPDYSPESVNYIHALAQAGCQDCSFYRAEKPGIFQGRMKTDSVVNPKIKGACPTDAANTKQDCPEHDPNCACHGPVMRRGFVGWAGGGTGPDFFVDTYPQPAKFWGNQHTVWGRIIDEESLTLIDNIYELPVTKGAGGMHYMDKPIHFTMSTSP